MKLRLTFLATIAAVSVLALLGVVRDIGTVHAAVPTPVQPFAARALGGVSTTTLGASIAHNYTITQANQGERTALPWIYSGPGFWVDPASGGTPPVGTVFSTIDVNCDGVVDGLYLICSTQTPLNWLEAPIVGAPAWLTAIMPPFTWKFRHEVVINHVCVGTDPTSSPSVLNTVYEELPSAPAGVGGHKGFFATTQLGGSPTAPPSKVCLDSPQSSTSDTSVYNNPPPAGATDGGPTGEVIGGEPRPLDNNSGLFLRWTVFKSAGSSSLSVASDLRKYYKTPPSIASDTGYVERTLQLDCFWMDDNGCPGCAGADNIITAQESWQDPDLLAMGGIDAVDKDRDCLMTAGTTQPGWPTDAIDTVPEDINDLCPPVPYSEGDVYQYDRAKDADCDGLPDGVEWAYGSSRTAPDTDSDSALDFVEMFQFTNPTVPDTDVDGNKDAPAGMYLNDGTGRDSSGNLVPENPNVDNCPSVSNGNQLNSDAKRRDAGPNMPDGAYASNPNQDKMGDACDMDDDNDWATDAYEGSGVGTNPLLFDTDGDTVADGTELRIQLFDPINVSATDKTKFPMWNSGEQVYYRGCQINILPAGTQQMDVDGDGIACPTDLDSDNGIYTGAARKPEVPDNVEAWGYGTLASNKDTDGDGCEDWVEIHDVNGDRTADNGDQYDLNRRVARKIAANAVTDLVFDVNKDTFVDNGDQFQLNTNNCGYKPGTGGCPMCLAEN